MTQMLIIGAHAVPLKSVFTGNFRIDMGESGFFHKFRVIFLVNLSGSGDPHGSTCKTY
jgi:hypothetical protein